jgi:hypothetical protein
VKTDRSQGAPEGPLEQAEKEAKGEGKEPQLSPGCWPTIFRIGAESGFIQGHLHASFF